MRSGRESRDERLRDNKIQHVDFPKPKDNLPLIVNQVTQ